jgi:hypothetical protein
MMVRAAVTGAIDFSHADPYDRKWMGHLRVVLAELERQSQLDIAATLHQHYVMLATVPRLKDESFKQMQDNASKLLDIILGQSTPWDTERISETRKTEVKAAVDEWEGHFGKLDDPAVQAAIDDTIAAVRKHRAEREIAQREQEDIWKGRRKGTRRERHRANRRNTRRT